MAFRWLFPRNSLEFVSKELKQHEQLVMLAISRPHQQSAHGRKLSDRPPLPVQFAAEELRADYDFMCPKSMKNDEKT